MSDDQRDRLLALEEWEAAVTAYAVEAADVLRTALAALNAGLPCQRPPQERLARLLDLRAREEEALSRCVRHAALARRS